MRYVIELAAFNVARMIDRQQHVRGKLAALFQNRHDRVEIVFSVCGQRFQIGRNIKQLVHNETHIAQRGEV